VRLKLIGVSLLLCVALTGTVFAAAGTVQAYQSFQENHQLVMAGDVGTVRSWMTLPSISPVLIFILAVLVVLFLSYQTFGMIRPARQQRALQRASLSAVPLEVSAASPRLSGSDRASSS